MSEIEKERATQVESNPQTETEVGTVKWFNETKGFGFIERPNGRDLFVHYKEIRGALKQGDTVSYSIGEAKKGPCAAKVKILKKSAGEQEEEI